jgi:hypothetical protein
LFRFGVLTSMYCTDLQQKTLDSIAQSKMMVYASTDVGEKTWVTVRQWFRLWGWTESQNLYSVSICRW